MKNPMSTEAQCQAVMDNAAGYDMQRRIIGSTAPWLDRHPDWVGEPLDFRTCEYRRKPELLELWVNVHQHGVTFSSKKYEDAVAYGQYYSGGTIHKMVEDTDWVEPEPEEKNPWRPIVNDDWPECGPMSKIEIKFDNGKEVKRVAGFVNWNATKAIAWRYAEDK